LLLNALWSQQQSGQALTNKHEAYSGIIKLPRRVRWLNMEPSFSPQHSHCWLVWDWMRDRRQLPFEMSAAEGRQCLNCRAPIDHLRGNAVTCSDRCRMNLSRRRRGALRRSVIAGSAEASVNGLALSAPDMHGQQHEVFMWIDRTRQVPDGWEEVPAGLSHHDAHAKLIRRCETEGSPVAATPSEAP
jgi:hypothetical protein